MPCLLYSNTSATTTTMSNNNVNRDSLASVNVQPHQGRQSYTISDRKKISVGEVDSFFEEELKECRAWIKPEKVNNMHKLVDRKYSVMLLY